MRILFLLLISPVWLLLWLIANLIFVSYRAIVDAVFPPSVALKLLSPMEYQPINRLSLPMPLWNLIAPAYMGLPTHFNDIPADKLFPVGRSSSWYY